MTTPQIDGAGLRRLALTSIFGHPRTPSTWSAAPASVADGLERLGFEVVGIDASVGRAAYVAGGMLHLLHGHGKLQYSEAIARGSFLRRRRATRIRAELARHGIRRVLHTGTLDFFPEERDDGIEHFLYCDATWQLSLNYRPDAALYTPRAIEAFDMFERAAYHSCSHIFTFGAYVRENLIDHYGVPAERVSAIGSGCGEMVPYLGEKDYSNGEILFVAKHLFREKGGELLLEAFLLAYAHNPNLRLTIVGGAGGRMPAPLPPNVTVLPFVTRKELTGLQQRAALLVQPMLNDPWGQVYLEALLARTPVIGLNRNGLPEITGYGAGGMLVDSATPGALACAILDAVSNPARLAEMGAWGQTHVLEHYSWGHVVNSMAAVLDPAPDLPADRSDMEAARTAA